MILESEKFAEFMLQFTEDKKVDVEDILKIESDEDGNNIAVYVPEDFIELLIKYIQIITLKKQYNPISLGLLKDL